MVRVKKGIEILEKKNKVKLTLSFRGREIVHKNIGINKVNKFIEDISEYGKPEADKSFSGKMIHVTIVPKKG